MAVGVLNSANIHSPLSVQLFLMSDSFELSDLPERARRRDRLDRAG